MALSGVFANGLATPMVIGVAGCAVVAFGIALATVREETAGHRIS